MSGDREPCCYSKKGWGGWQGEGKAINFKSPDPPTAGGFWEATIVGFWFSLIILALSKPLESRS